MNCRPASTESKAAANSAGAVGQGYCQFGRLRRRVYPEREVDSPVLPELLSQIPECEESSTVTADGAYQNRPYNSRFIERKARAFIPIRKNRRPSKESCPAARTQTRVRHVTTAGRSGNAGPDTTPEA